jgi:hypothetical protein
MTLDRRFSTLTVGSNETNSSAISDGYQIKSVDTVKKLDFSTTNQSKPITVSSPRKPVDVQDMDLDEAPVQEQVVLRAPSIFFSGAAQGQDADDKFIVSANVEGGKLSGQTKISDFFKQR